LNNIADYLRRYRELMEHWRKVVPTPLLEVPYEQLVRDPEAWTREVLSFIGLDPNVDRDMTVAPEISPREVGHWRHYREQIGPLLQGDEPA
jgi:LPS sulfotransferase NodH